ncbi:hypothetical protein DIM_11840 [Candidatus Denitrolinea symbiosum]|nr:hypothetical protein DIM_11840 [Candidatus Denitrolinea symbiosum]
MNTKNCPSCNGLGYYISYYGDVEEDPRRITCHHNSEVAEAKRVRSATKTATAGRNKTGSQHTNICHATARLKIKL